MCISDIVKGDAARSPPPPNPRPTIDTPLNFAFYPPLFPGRLHDNPLPAITGGTDKR